MSQIHTQRSSSEKIRQQARDLRSNMTPAERRLWEFLRKRRLSGYRFRRQHPIGSYIVDFYCCEFAVAVEVEGNVHLEEAQFRRDMMREWNLGGEGIRVVCVTNNEIFNNVEAALLRIKRALQSKR